MDTLEVVENLGQILKNIIHSCIFYCVSLFSDTANCIFVHNTTHESWIKVTISVWLVPSHSQQIKMFNTSFTLCFPITPYSFLVVYMVSFSITSPYGRWEKNLFLDSGSRFSQHITLSWSVAESGNISRLQWLSCNFFHVRTKIDEHHQQLFYGRKKYFLLGRQVSRTHVAVLMKW